MKNEDEELGGTVEPDEPVRLTPEEEEELLEAVEDIRRGNWVDGQALLEELRSHLKR